MAGMKIRKGDRVRVLAGKDRGAEGVVMFALPAQGKVIVEGVNLAKKHQKPTRSTQQGGIIEKDMPMPVSRGDHLPQLWGTVQDRLPVRTRRQQGPDLPQVQEGPAMTQTSTLIAPPRLKARYNDEIRARLKDELGLPNIMMVPTIEKISINMGGGAALQKQSLLEGALTDLEIISGQKPITTRAKKSIAGFKLREGNPIGAKVTLRGDRMWEFLDRLITLAIPRIRDFRGLPATSFDGHGNYTFGVTEQLIFPEVDYDRVDATRGMDITIVTTARTNAEGKALLDAFGFPFKREGQQ